jgi:hypothetical protein
MKFRRESQRIITVESYVTLRSEWLHELASQVPSKYNARGHRVVDGHMEWQYFADEGEARKWSDAVHRHPDPKNLDLISAASSLVVALHRHPELHDCEVQMCLASLERRCGPQPVVREEAAQPA